MPGQAVDDARELLRERLRAPKPGLADQKRKRLMTCLEQLKKLVGWGDITDDEYLREEEAVECQLVSLQDNDKLVLFDRHRQIVESLKGSLERTAPEQRREVVRLPVERAVAYGKAVQEIRWVPPVRPFFGGETAQLEVAGVVLARPARLELTTFRSAT